MIKSGTISNLYISLYFIGFELLPLLYFARKLSVEKGVKQRLFNDELLKIIKHYFKLEEYESALILCNIAIKNIKNNDTIKIYKEKKQEIENLINNQENT